MRWLYLIRDGQYMVVSGVVSNDLWPYHIREWSTSWPKRLGKQVINYNSGQQRLLWLYRILYHLFCNFSLSSSLLFLSSGMEAGLIIWQDEHEPLSENRERGGESIEVEREVMMLLRRLHSSVMPWSHSYSYIRWTRQVELGITKVRL